MPSTASHAEAPRSELALSSKRHALHFSEEERLLGATRSKNDAGAVRIGMPQTRVPAVKIPSGGPRPSNTLNAITQDQRASQAINPKLRGGYRKELDVEYSRGSNVTNMPHANGFQEVFTLPTAKRQKMKHEPSSPTSSSSMDALDTMPSASVNFVPPSQSQHGSRAPSVHSQGSGPSRHMRRSASSNGSVQEYKSIERLMSSNTRSVKRQRRRNSHNQQKNHDLLATSTISDPIDISGDDEMIMDSKPMTAPRMPHQRTMRKPPSTANVSNTSGILQGSSTGKQSPLFLTSSHNSNMQKLSQSLAGDDPEGRLAKKFVQIDGKRRGSDVNMSSDLDELQNGGDTVRHLATSRQSSPTKGSHSTIKAASSNELSRGLPESNIEPTNWAKAEPKARNRSHARDSIRRLREKSPSWAIEIAELSYAGQVVNDSGLGLVYKDTSRVYTVMSNGKPTSVLIQPDKLQTITWGTSGCKARFGLSKTGTEDNTVDIEFRRERDMSELVKKLQTQSLCKTKTRDSAYMDKIFERRRQDFQNYSKAIPRSPLVPYNVRYDASGQALCQTGSPASAEAKGHRTGTKLVDTLFDRAAQEDQSKAMERVARPVPNGLPTEKSIREVLGELKPPRRTGFIRQQDQNSHLRRSTRTSGATTRAPDDIWAHLEDVPVEEKYSKTHGLGKAWSKPLTYPREGRKKTTVEFSDLERLDEGEFLNDNLISFYLRFLEQELGDRRPDVAKRVYFFNTYFYATLTNTHKGKKCFNYEGVQKWTRTVDLFTYDYIIVPINESSHWYLAIICNLPALDRNLDSPGDAASSQAEIGGTAVGNRSDEFALPSSNPTVPEVAREGSAALVEDAEDETEARNSFAEMSLDNGLKQSALDLADTGKARHAQAVDQEAEDQEMLDAQLEDGLLGSVMPKTDNVYSGAKAAWLPSLAKQQVQDSEEPAEDQDDQPKASTGRLRKLKRKSVPPAVTKTDPNKPAIMLFDSLGLSRGPTIKTLKEYLHAEARTKRGGMSFDGGQIKGINAKVPLQTNFSDCGLFLLGYVAKFLENDPRGFIANIIGRNYETKDWTKLAPSTLRANIRDQVQELHRIQEEERQSARKAGKFQDKNDSKSEASPTRGPAGPAKILGLDLVASGSEPPTKPVELPIADPPEPGQVELDAKLSRPEHDFDKGKARVTLSRNAIDHNETERTFHETDKAIEAAAAEISPPRARTSLGVEQDERQESTWTQAEPIIIDSESQIGLSARKSLEPLAQDPRPGSRLPSEIADSQPSAPATRGHLEHLPRKSASPPCSEAMKSFEKILSKQGLQHSITRAQDATGGEAHKVTVEILTERPRKEIDRSRRRRSTRNNLEEDDVQVIDVIDVIDVDD